LDECNTQLLTFNADASPEEELLLDDDNFVMERDRSTESKPTTKKFNQSPLETSDGASVDELGDDRAEEGKL
jgi:hypothetical protein